jgi:urease accessory protein
MKSFSRAVMLGAAAWTPQDAFAHTIVPGFSGFQGGLLHPLLVPSHAISIVALALLLSTRTPGERHAMLATFAASLSGAVVLLALAFQTERAETVLLISAAVGGIMTAARIAFPLLAIASLLAVAGFALQIDSVPTTISVNETLLTLAGAGFAAFAALWLIATAAARATRPWQILAIRIVGSWIAAAAILVLAMKLR